jgi:hypothetical protein
MGIDELAYDMREYGLAADDFDGPRYVRLARIRELIAAGRLDSDLRAYAAQPKPAVLR